MAFIGPMYRNKPNIIYLLTCTMCAGCQWLFTTVTSGLILSIEDKALRNIDSEITGLFNLIWTALYKLEWFHCGIIWLNLIEWMVSVIWKFGHPKWFLLQVNWQWPCICWEKTIPKWHFENLTLNTFFQWISCHLWWMTTQLVLWLAFENYQLHGWQYCNLAIFWQISLEFCQGMTDWYNWLLLQYHKELVFVKHQIWHAACYNMEILCDEMQMSHYSKFQHYIRMSWLGHAHQSVLVWSQVKILLLATYFSLFLLCFCFFGFFWSGWSLIFVLIDLPPFDDVPLDNTDAGFVSCGLPILWVGNHRQCLALK